MSKIKGSKICFLAGRPSFPLYFYGDLLKEICTQGADLCVISCDDENLKKFSRKINCRLLPVNITRKMTPLRDMLACLRVFCFFLKKRFDILHVHTPKGGIIGLTAGFLARVPVRVYTIHGLPLETASGIKRCLLWLIEKISCAFATQVLAVSDSLKEKVIQEKLCSYKKVTVLEYGTACGIDINRFFLDEKAVKAGRQIRARLHIPSDAVVVGFIGRLTPEKGIDTLTKAFLEMVEKRSNVFLLLAGPLDTERETFTSSLLRAIEDHPRIRAVVELVDPVGYYAAMDILTLPSRREGFGMTLIEAGAMQRPVVATRVTGCVDAVEEGQTGLLFSLDDSVELADALIRLVDDSQMRYQFGTIARKRVEEKFMVNRLLKAHLSFYEKLMK